MKPTYGFLIGFATAAPIAGALIKTFQKKNVTAYLISGELGMLSYYVCGLLYFYLLSNFLLGGDHAIGIRELMAVWFLSSVGHDIAIAAVASLLAHRLVPVFRRMRN